MVLNRTDLKSIFFLGRLMPSLLFCMDMIERLLFKGSMLTLDLERLKQGVEKLGDTETAEDVDKLLKKLNRKYKYD